MLDVQTSPITRLRWLSFKNDATEEVPPFAPMRVVSLDMETGVYTCGKPNADGMGNVVFNGPFEIANGDYGSCTRDFPCVAYYDTADGLPVAGEIWGTKANEWKLRKGKAGFTIHGGAVAAEARVFVLAQGGGDGERTGVARVISRRPDGYYTSRLGTGTFNTATKAFPTGRDIIVVDAAEIVVP